MRSTPTFDIAPNLIDGFGRLFAVIISGMKIIKSPNDGENMDYKIFEFIEMGWWSVRRGPEAMIPSSMW